jgi:hypothetical protein
MSLSSIPERSSTLQLRDGRTLGVAWVGKTDGFPIFHFHSNGTSRLEVLTVQCERHAVNCYRSVTTKRGTFFYVKCTYFILT